jgi:peptidoglycan/xylan/chitin deacetylase (PgdA/CDA1 family)
MNSRIPQAVLLALLASWSINPLFAAQCKSTVYLTFDTGSQSQAGLIADTLKKHEVKATFFLANEKTVKGDSSLEQGWTSFWKQLLAQGHVFGSHTFDHVYLRGDGSNGTIRVRPQFGANAGKEFEWTAEQFCSELKRVDAQFKTLTGQGVGPIWRAPGGKVSARSLRAAAECGYQHVGWSPAGFSGDELSSETYPNKKLLEKAVHDLRDGDIFVAHLGIWSRKDAWAPAVLDPLIAGLKERGFCFATLKDHPQYKALWK